MAKSYQKMMSLSEVMTIQVLFHISGYKTFKEFYKGHVTRYMFPRPGEL